MTLSVEDLRRMAERPVVDANGAVVGGDVPCRKCQYNLRGLSVDGRCPECGTPVGYSTRGDLLRFSEPAWVGTLRTGVSVILWGILMATLAALGGTVARRAGHRQVPTLALNLASGLLSLVGAWLLTTPDPSGLGEDRYGTARKVIRVTLVIGLARELAALVHGTGTWPPLADLLFAATGVAASLIAVVGTFATLNYLAKLAVRIPDRSLERRARLLMYGYGIPRAAAAVLAGVMVVLFRTGTLRGATAAAARRGSGSGLLALGCAGGLGGIALIVFGLMYLFMLGRFSRAFKVQAAFARSSWAAELPTPLPPPPPA